MNWTPALIRHSCEELPSTTTQSNLLVTNGEIKTKIWPKISWLSLLRKLTLYSVKSIKYIKYCNMTSIRRCALNEKTWNLIFKLKKILHFLNYLTSLIIYKVLKMSRNFRFNFDKGKSSLDSSLDTPT